MTVGDRFDLTGRWGLSRESAWKAAPACFRSIRVSRSFSTWS